MLRLITPLEKMLICKNIRRMKLICNTFKTKGNSAVDSVSKHHTTEAYRDMEVKMYAL